MDKKNIAVVLISTFLLAAAFPVHSAYADNDVAMPTDSEIEGYFDYDRQSASEVIESSSWLQVALSRVNMEGIDTSKFQIYSGNANKDSILAQYAALQNDFENKGFGEEFVLKEPAALQSAKDAKSLFESKYGDAFDKMQMEKAEIPADFDTTTLAHDFMHERDNAYQTVVNDSNSLYNKVVNQISTGLSCYNAALSTKATDLVTVKSIQDRVAEAQALAAANGVIKKTTPEDIALAREQVSKYIQDFASNKGLSSKEEALNAYNSSVSSLFTSYASASSGLSEEQLVSYSIGSYDVNDLTLVKYDADGKMVPASDAEKETAQEYLTRLEWSEGWNGDGGGEKFAWEYYTKYGDTQYASQMFKAINMQADAETGKTTSQVRIDYIMNAIGLAVDWSSTIKKAADDISSGTGEGSYLSYVAYFTPSTYLNALNSPQTAGLSNANDRFNVAIGNSTNKGDGTATSPGSKVVQINPSNMVNNGQCIAEPRLSGGDFWIYFKNIGSNFLPDPKNSCYVLSEDIAVTEGRQGQYEVSNGGGDDFKFEVMTEYETGTDAMFHGWSRISYRAYKDFYDLYNQTH